LATEIFLVESYWPRSDDNILQTSVGDLLRNAAEAAPDRVALIDGTRNIADRREWTYRQLLKIVENIAYALTARFAPGDRIALCSPNCPEWVMVELGIFLAGMVLVPINPAYQRAEIEQIVSGADVAAILHVDRFRKHDVAATVSMLKDVQSGKIATISLAALSLLTDFRDHRQALPAVGPEDIAIIQFTSGTTGTPKGACLRHIGILNSARFAARRTGFREGGIWINGTPMFHVGGAVLTFLGTLNAHGTYVLMPEWDARLALELIERERAEAILIVPTMIHAMLDEPEFGRFNLSSLRIILTGAAAVAPQLIQDVKKRLHCDIVITFGQTESSGTFTLTSPLDSVADQSETVGQPLPSIEVAIVDPETGAVLPTGAPGEIRVRGFLTMAGYFGQNATTAQTLTPDGWLCTGDIGTMDSRGYLRITGRLKDMIIRGGMNIYPREIEEVLIGHAAVGQVCVVGLPDPYWGEILAAVIIPADSFEALCASALHSHCREHLSPHKTPVKWFVTKDFPLTPSGKVQKFALQEMIGEDMLTPIMSLIVSNSNTR